MNPAPSRQHPADLVSTNLSPEAAGAWSALLEVLRLARAGPLPLAPSTLTAGEGLITWSASAGWELTPEAQAQAQAETEARALLDLYLPLLPPEPTATLTLAHLGQSLDGFIATTRGESRYITGPANIRHLHCLRALADAVLVGAETVAADDPRLTTRLVPGDNPVRVILDPRRRLPLERQVFQDGAAPTLLVCAAGPGASRNWGQAEVVTMAATAEGRLPLDVLVAELHRRGLRRLFVEGGGLTVSRFLAAGLLDRLHLAVAPLVIGEGRRGLSLPASPALGECLRPGCRVFRMGADILFDCDVRASLGVATTRAGAEVGVSVQTPAPQPFPARGEGVREPAACSTEAPLVRKRAERRQVGTTSGAGVDDLLVGVGTSAGAEPAKAMTERRRDDSGVIPDLFRIY